MSQVRKVAGEQDEIRTVLVHVDIEEGRQRILGSPIAGPVRPLGFSEGERVALLAREERATAKIDLEDGRLVTVADAIYLGQLDDR